MNKRLVTLFVIMAFFGVDHQVQAAAVSCLPGSDCYQYSCTDGLLHLNTEGAGEKLYLVKSDGSSTLINTYQGDFRQNLATNSSGETYTIQNKGGKKVLSRLNADSTVTCVAAADCSVDVGIPGSIESMGFGFDGSLFAVDVTNEVIYWVNTNTGLASLYYNLKAVSGDNAADGYFGIDFQGGDLVVTKNNQIVYVRYTDGAVYRIDLYFPTSRAFLGFLPNQNKRYTSLAQIGSTFYAFEANNDDLQPFTIGGDELNVLPLISSAAIGSGDAASCPEAPVDECQQNNILLNGGFEALDDRLGLVHNDPLNLLGQAGNSSWEVFQSLPDVTDGSLYSWFTTNGAGIEVQRNTIVPAHGGNHYVELDSHPNAQNGNVLNATMTQFIGLNGGDYELSFWYRPRTVNANDNTIEVLLDGTLVHTANGNNNAQWVQESFILNNVASGYYEVSFRAAGTANQLGGFLDDISMTCHQEVLPVCGNQILEPGEQCDDGNSNPGDGCSQSCQIEVTPVCGNEVVESGEQCDDGNATPGDGCDQYCLTEITPDPVCGNEVVESGEQCDDGNTNDGDGCSEICTTEDYELPICGNNILEAGEECDDGNVANSDGCSSVCTSELNVTACGNGVLEVGEACDDGNVLAGDGCDAECALEPTGNDSPGNQPPEDGNTNNVPDEASGDQPGSDCESGNCEEVDDPAPQAGPVPAGGGFQVQGSGASCSLSPMNSGNYAIQVLLFMSGLAYVLFKRRSLIKN